MASVPPFDPSEVAPDWIGDKDQFTYFGNRIKGFISSWRKAFTKAETNVTEFYNDPSDEMKELAQQSFQNMEVTFAAMANSYEMAAYVAGEVPELQEKATKMMSKFSSYEAERDLLESRLKEGFKRLRTCKDHAEAKARTDAATASINAAARVTSSAQATAGAAAPTPDISAVYCEALRPKTQLSTECKPEVYAEWKSSIKAWMEMSGFDRGSANTRTELIKKCLSTEFAIQIKPFLVDNAEPNGPQGIFAVIDSAYKRAYPIFAKRMAALTRKIGGNEDVDAFYAKYMTMLEEEQIEKMSRDELYGMMMMIALDPINDLREKLFEIEGQPTIMQVHEKIQKWKMGKVLNKAASKSANKVNNIRGGGRGGRGGRGRGGRGGAQSGANQMPSLPHAPAHIKITPHTLYGRCFVCGGTDHQRQNCPKAHDARCEPNGCGKTGHYKATCFDAYYKWKQAWENAGCPASGPLAPGRPPNPGARGRGRGSSRGGRGGHQIRAIDTEGEQEEYQEGDDSLLDEDEIDE